MSKIYVMPDGMKKELNTMTQIQREIKGIENSVHSVAIGLHITGGAGIKLRAAIRNKEKAIQESREDIGRLQHAGNEIVQSYERTERAIVDPSLKTKATTADGNAKPKWGASVADLAWKTAGKFGVLGTVVSAVGAYHTGSKKTADKIKVVKKAVDGIHGILAGKDSGDSWWSILTGLGKYDTAEKMSIAARWKDAVTKSHGNHGIGKGAEGIGKLTIATQWISTGLSLAATIASNYDEYKDNGGFRNGRMWLETAVETGVDTFVGWGAKTLAGAGVAAILGPGAPVVAVGVVTVGIVWGADFITKKITKAVTGEEKGLTETVSDAIIDGGSWLINKAGSAAKGVKNGFAKWKSKFAW